MLLVDTKDARELYLLCHYIGHHGALSRTAHLPLSALILYCRRSGGGIAVGGQLLTAYV